MALLTANHSHRIFKKLGRNNDDLVSVNDLRWLLEYMKFSSNLEEIECFVGKKNLNFGEFVYLCNSLCPQKAASNIENNDLLKSFEVFDSNLDGFISCEELRNALSILGLIDEHNGMDVNEMIKANDVNFDGLLDFDELKKMML